MKSALEKQSSLEKLNQYEFLSVGLSCHALCLLHSSGYLEKLASVGGLSENEVQNSKNPHLVRAAIATLIGTKLAKLKKGVFKLTSFGKKISKEVDALAIPFIGYRKLLAKQFELLNSSNAGWEDSEIDYTSIAVASIHFGENDLDPLLLDLFKSINPKETICDLGCGTGNKLIKLCKFFGTSGLGIDKDAGAINQSKYHKKGQESIEFVQADVTQLNGIWEDVDTVLISFLFHDIDGGLNPVEFLSSLKNHFPRLRCIVIADMVSFSENSHIIMPGFDYVHGLQGVTPRSYEETLDVFIDAKLTIMSETLVPNMPNTYLWALTV